VRGVPELMVEIGSPSTRRRDETIKRHLYERTGVTEYWVLDPELESSAFTGVTTPVSAGRSSCRPKRAM
jgi:Uma2 family endonuclease